MDLSKLHLDWGSSRYKGKVYRSYNLARCVWVDGKNKKEPVIKLGKLTDAEVKKWRSLLEAVKNPDYFLTSFDDIVVEKHFAYLDVAVAYAIWDEWGLDKVFKSNGKRIVGIEKTARILTINRCIDPASKSRTPAWFRETALPWMTGVNPREFYPSRVFRDLAVIENHKEAICQFLFGQFVRSNSESMKSVFYDLSSSSFEGVKCKLMNWGHCKDGYKNHIVLALVVNKDGLPFYWEVLPGCTADSKTIVWLLDRLRNKFDLPEITMVFDRGMVSDDNLALLQEDKIKYISAMDRNQIEKITGIDFSAFSNLLPEKIAKQAEHMPGFVKIDKNTFYREIGLEGKRRYILCFNPQLFKDQRKAREQSIVNFRIFADNLNAELLAAKNSRQKKPTHAKFEKKLKRLKLNGFVDVSLTRKYIRRREDGVDRKILTYQGKVEINDDKRRSAGKLDGFWLLVTNHFEENEQGFVVKPEEAIAPYREKEVIEEAFRDIKSFVEIEPIHVWTEEHVKAHYSICVLSYLIDRTITIRLHKSKGGITKETVAHQKLFKELSKCRLDYIGVENIHQRKFNLTKQTARQEELLRRVDLPSLTSRKILDSANKNPDYAEDLI